MVLHTYRTTLSKPHTNLGATTLRLIPFYKPTMSASYSTMVFIHSNSKWFDIKCFIFFVLIKTHCTLEPSYIFGSSKYMVDNSYVCGPFNVLALLLLLQPLVLLLLLLLLPVLQCVVEVSFPLVGKGRRPNCMCNGVGFGCAR